MRESGEFKCFKHRETKWGTRTKPSLSLDSPGLWLQLFEWIPQNEESQTFHSKCSTGISLRPECWRPDTTIQVWASNNQKLRQCSDNGFKLLQNHHQRNVKGRYMSTEQKMLIGCWLYTPYSWIDADPHEITFPNTFNCMTLFCNQETHSASQRTHWPVTNAST